MAWLILAFLSTVLAVIFLPLVQKKNAIRIIIFTSIIFISLALYQYIIPYYYAITFEKTIRKENSIVNLIATDAPYAFDAYLDKVKNSILARESKDQQYYFTTEFINSAFAKYLPLATNESIYHFYQTEVIFDKKLYQDNPQLVLAVEFMDKVKEKVSPDIIKKIAGDALLTELSNAKEAVIRSAITTPQLPLSDAEKQQAADIIAAIKENLSKKYGADTLLLLLQNPDSPSLDKTIAAEIIITLYEEILSTGVNQAGLVFRYLLLSQHQP